MRDGVLGNAQIGRRTSVPSLRSLNATLHGMLESSFDHECSSITLAKEVIKTNYRPCDDSVDRTRAWAQRVIPKFDYDFGSTRGRLRDRVGGARVGFLLG